MVPSHRYLLRRSACTESSTYTCPVCLAASDALKELLGPRHWGWFPVELIEKVSGVLVIC